MGQLTGNLLYAKGKKEICDIISYIASQIPESKDPDTKITCVAVEGIITRFLINLHLEKTFDENVKNEDSLFRFESDYLGVSLKREIEILTREVLEKFSASQSICLKKISFSQALGLLHQCVLEKYGLRKQDGIYYTPDTVVGYMTERTLLPFLAKVHRELKRLAGEGNQAAFIRTIQEVRNYRVIDPACGAGAFLVRVFEIFAEFYQRALSMAQNLWLESDLKSISGNPALYILTNHIVGVDLDPEAVRLTRLSLYYQALKQYDGGSGEFAEGLMDAVRVGNSLTEEIAARESFDLVIGNPPYIANKSLPQGTKTLIKEKFKTVTGQFDSIVPFIELGINLLKKGGSLCYITSNKFLAADYGFPVRRLMLEKLSLEELTDLSSQKIFADAAAYPVIFSGRKKTPDKTTMVKLVNDNKESLIPQDFFRTLGGSVITTNLSEQLLPVMEKIQNWPGRINSGKIFCGIASAGFNKNICASPNQKVKRIILAGDIEKYEIKAQDRYYPSLYLNKRQSGYFSAVKLVIPGMCRHLKAAIDFEGCCLGRVYYITLSKAEKRGSQPPFHDLRRQSLFYLLALYNSAVLDFYYRVLYWPVHLSGGFLRINSTYLATMPIPYWSGEFVEENPKSMTITALAEKLHNTRDREEKEELLAQMEAHVFELYSLSLEEARLILEHTDYPSDKVAGILQNIKMR